MIFAEIGIHHLL